MSMLKIQPLCGDGTHRPRRPTQLTPAGGKRTVCRDCGCALVQPGMSRKWILSGRLA